MARIPFTTLSPGLQTLIREIDSSVSEVQALSLDVCHLIETAREKLAEEAAAENLTTYLNPETQKYCDSEDGLKVYRKYSKISSRVRVIQKNWGLDFKGIAERFSGQASSTLFIRELSQLSQIVPVFEDIYPQLKEAAAQRVNRTHTRRGVTRRPWAPTDVKDVISDIRKQLLSRLEKDWEKDETELSRLFDVNAITLTPFVYVLAELASASSFANAYPKLKVVAEQRLSTLQPGTSRALWCVTDVVKVIRDIEEEEEEEVEQGNTANEQSHAEDETGHAIEVSGGAVEDEVTTSIEREKPSEGLSGNIFKTSSSNIAEFQLRQPTRKSSDDSVLQGPRISDAESSQSFVKLASPGRQTPVGARPVVARIATPSTTNDTESNFGGLEPFDDDGYENQHFDDGFSDSTNESDEDLQDDKRVDDTDGSFHFTKHIKRKRESDDTSFTSDTERNPKKNRLSEITVEYGRKAPTLPADFRDAVDDTLFLEDSSHDPCQRSNMLEDATCSFSQFEASSRRNIGPLIEHNYDKSLGHSSFDNDSDLTKEQSAPISLLKDTKRHCINALPTHNETHVRSLLTQEIKFPLVESTIDFKENSKIKPTNNRPLGGRVTENDITNGGNASDDMKPPVLQIDLTDTSDESRGSLESELFERYKTALSTLLPGRSISSTVFEVVLDPFKRQDVMVSDSQWISTSRPLSRSAARRSGMFRKFLIPLHHNSLQHWTIAYVDLDSNRVDHYDSLKSADTSSAVKEALVSSFADLSTETHFTTVDCPQQQNNWDCGVFALVFGLCRLSNTAIPQEIDGPLWRELFGDIFKTQMALVSPLLTLRSELDLDRSQEPQNKLAAEPSSSRDIEPSLSKLKQVVEARISQLEIRRSQVELAKHIVHSSQSSFLQEAESQHIILRDGEHSRRILDAMPSSFQAECLAVVDKMTNRAQAIVKDTPRRCLILMGIYQRLQHITEISLARISEMRAVLAHEQSAGAAMMVSIAELVARETQLVVKYQSEKS